jgi:hypothetical protein
MTDPRRPAGKSFTAFRSAAEEAQTRRGADGAPRSGQQPDNEGGHMSSTCGRVIRRPGAHLPFVAILSHHGSECTERAFATMREAESFIKRNTPVPGRTLSELYDRPASDS